MKIKGHTIIELTDVNTGAKERYEKDNMVTHALDKYFEDIGAFNISPLYNSDVRNNLIPRLLGGLLLLDTPLTENADNIICPSGVEMVGNGSYNVSSGNEDLVTEMGTYDQLESGWRNDGKMIMVWNFSENQANGKDENQKIACVCLTSANHGYIGEGNATSGRAKATRKSDLTLTGDPVNISVDDGSNQGERIIRASKVANTVTMIDEYNFDRTTGHENEHMSETGKVKIVTHKAPIKKLDMRFGAGNQYIPVTETEVSFDSAFKTALNHNNPQITAKVGDTYFMAHGFGYTDESGGVCLWYSGNMHLLRINADNTTSYYAVANPKGSTMRFKEHNMTLVGNKLVVTDWDTGIMWFINVTNQADITNHTDAPKQSCGFVYPTQNVMQTRGYKIDVGTSKVYPINSNMDDSSRIAQYLTENPLTTLFGNNTGIYKSTNYLATINNLETPIKKTSSKTMKVTYVLDFDDGE